MSCPPETRYIREVDAAITLADCSGETTLLWGCPPTKTVGIDAATDKTFSLGCILFTGTESPLPTYTTWPPGELVWEEDEDGDDDKKSTCRLWFFFVSHAGMPRLQVLLCEFCGLWWLRRVLPYSFLFIFSPCFLFLDNILLYFFQRCPFLPLFIFSDYLLLLSTPFPSLSFYYSFSFSFFFLNLTVVPLLLFISSSFPQVC
jgi:hypothetical protein